MFQAESETRELDKETGKLYFTGKQTTGLNGSSTNCKVTKKF